MDDVTLTNLRLVLAARILAASRRADAEVAQQEIARLIAVLPEDDGETDTAHLARVARTTWALDAALRADGRWQ
jgi:HD superfamily phosphodiesterase